MSSIRKGDLVRFEEDPLLDVEHHFFYGNDSEVYLVLSNPRMKVVGPRELLMVELLFDHEVRDVPIAYLTRISR